MDELGKVKRVIEKRSPVDEVLLVLDATTGQNGMRQAKVFSEVVNITGIVLTKLDGTAKGGIVVAVQRELGVPVKLVGLGEGPDDLAPFDPEADPVHDARAIVNELRRYDQSLYEKPRWLVLNKLDLIPEDERVERIKAFVDAYGSRGPVFGISAISGDGCQPLVFQIQDWLDANRVVAATSTIDSTDDDAASVRDVTDERPISGA